ncbi:MAG: anthranilate phosphoribosyltransferase [Limisphaerales bacterium]
MVLIDLTKQLAGGTALTDEQVSDAVSELVGEKETAEVKADFLAALAQKGETAEEIAGFARALQARAIAPPLDVETRSREIIDVCGTGGDRLNTFNISTTVALVVAAAGVSVAKHGNRAMTSQAGSADVLEALGIKIDLTPDKAAAWLRDHHFAFFFAPNCHPAFKQIAPARRLCGERGQRTIFNFLGPLLNPARPTSQLVGVPRRELCAPIAAVLQRQGVRRGMVVCGSVIDGDATRYLDEFSTLGDNCVVGFPQDMQSNSSRRISFQAAKLADLAGGNREANAEIVRRLLRGEERGPKRDAILLNSAAAMIVAGKCRSFADGWDMAAELIDSGKVGSKLQELIAASKGA